MKNQKGFASIIMASIVLLMIVTFMGSASVYFSALYRDIMVQQRAVAADAIMEDFGKMVQQASHIYRSNGNACPGSGITQDLDPVNRLCWPRAGGANQNANCVRTPFGSGSTGTQLICRTQNPGSALETRNTMGVITAQIESDIMDDRPFVDRFRFVMIASLEQLEVGLDVVAEKIQNVAIAQTAEMAHMPTLAGAPAITFPGAVICPVGGGGLAGYCKYCQAGLGDFQTCVRLRVCLRPTGCDPADDSEWVRRTIGILNR